MEALLSTFYKKEKLPRKEALEAEPIQRAVPNGESIISRDRNALEVRTADMQKPRLVPRFLQQEKRRGKMKKMVGSNL